MTFFYVYLNVYILLILGLLCFLTTINLEIPRIPWDVVVYWTWCYYLYHVISGVYEVKWYQSETLGVSWANLRGDSPRFLSIVTFVNFNWTSIPTSSNLDYHPLSLIFYQINIKYSGMRIFFSFILRLAYNWPPTIFSILFFSARTYTPQSEIVSDQL